MGVSYVPWMGTITLPTANTAYQLSARLLALATAQQPPISGEQARCQFLTLQANPNGLANTLYYIGNADMTTSFYGVVLFATQVWPIYSMESNLIRMNQIYVMATANNETMNVSFIAR